ncbi:MAG: hypothetical protein OHK0022_61830 [Roseiflexaceae bacterium]
MDATLYSLLGVTTDVDGVAITLAYARCLQHPVSGVERATLTYAFLVLSDPQRRALYDATLHKQVTESGLEEQAARDDGLSSTPG